MQVKLTLFIFQSISLYFAFCDPSKKQPTPGKSVSNKANIDDPSWWNTGHPVNIEFHRHKIRLNNVHTQFLNYHKNISHTKHEGRIIGGQDAELHQLPFQVAIKLNGNQWCGGSIIAKTWIVTAAHCFFDFDEVEVPKSNFTMVGGEHNIAIIEGMEQNRKLKQVVIHPIYEKDKKNDIALVEVEEPFDLNEAVKIIQTAKSSSTYNNKTCTVSGWGSLIPNRRSFLGGGIFGLLTPGFPDILKVVNVDIIEKELCKKLHSASGASSYAAHTSVICAGVLAGGKDACQVDSGGPLVCNDKSQKPLLVGIVQSGVGCGRKDLPGFYTEVSKFESFILKHVPDLKKPEPGLIHHHTNCTCTCTS